MLRAASLLSAIALTGLGILGLWGCWHLSQAVQDGRAFPTMPHAEPTR